MIIRTVGPQAVISENVDDLLSLLSSFEDVGDIPNWNTGGQIYLDYIVLMKSPSFDLFKTLDVYEVAEEAEDVQSWWPKWIRGIPVQDVSLKDSLFRLRDSLVIVDIDALEFESVVAVQEMAKVVGVDV